MKKLRIMGTDVVIFTVGFKIEDKLKRRIAVLGVSENNKSNLTYWDGVEFANFILNSSSKQFARRVYKNLKREFGWKRLP